MSSVFFSQAKDAELAWVDGQIHLSTATSKGVIGSEEAPLGKEEKIDHVPVLEGLPTTQVCIEVVIAKQRFQDAVRCLV